MRTFLTGALLALTLVLPAAARNIAVPDKDPAVLVTVPDSWKVEEIAYGYSAASPGKDVMFFVEHANAKNLDGMMATNKKWMKENEIDDSVQPKEAELDFNGVKGTVYRFDTKDANGPTRVDFVILPAGKSRVIMLTLWGSAAERSKHAAAVDAIMTSVKPLN